MCCCCSVSSACALRLLDERHRLKGLPGAQPRHRLQVGQHQCRCLVACFGHRGVDRQERERLGGQGARLEPGAVQLERFFGSLAGEVVGEHIRQPLGGGQVRRVHRRAEQPESRFAGRGRGGLEPVVPGAQRNHHAAGAHQRGHVVEVVGKVLDVAFVVGAAQGVRRHRVGAGRPADAQVDAARGGRFQQRELLGHRQRRMVGQHHAARAESQLRGLRGQVGDQHRRAGGAHGRHVVVFGDPVARETQPVGGLRERHGGRQRVGGRLVGAHRDEIKDGKTHDGVNAVGRANVPGRLRPSRRKSARHAERAGDFASARR